MLLQLLLYDRAMAGVACVGFMILQAVQCRENFPSDLRDPLFAGGYWIAAFNHGLLPVRGMADAKVSPTKFFKHLKWRRGGGVEVSLRLGPARLG